MVSKVESDLWCEEFEGTIIEVLEKGAEKYAPHDWEQPDAQSIKHPKNIDAILHHTAREFVYLENN